MDHDNLEPQEDQTDPIEPGEAAEAAETAEPHGQVEGAEELESLEPGAPVVDSEVVPSKPREHIRGIHPELLCSCEECEPECTELQWFSVDEARKIKGTAMLYCARSGLKYFTPVTDLQAFLTANPVKGRKHQAS